MRTLVTFFGKEFNSAQPKAEFSKPTNYGDDVCRWLIAEMKEAGVDADDEPQQDDNGWYYCFRIPVGRFCVIVTCRPADDPEESLWICWIENHCGFVGSLLGHRLKNISPHAVECLHRVFNKPNRVTGALWHNYDKFKQGYEQSGAVSPDE
ncbi:MAG: hypothetical protein KC897_00265 [Candidatus Omnitrophica bacterium]|nr:hypothetical protein [Candidatus Omnitrophota bacterium]MCB9721991.1 hypothetical protein [Candidatus Omnitrophota bacterium]